MIKEAETEETIVFFVTFLSSVAFQLGGGWAPWAPPLATPMVPKVLFQTAFDILKKVFGIFSFLSSLIN